MTSEAGTGSGPSTNGLALVAALGLLTGAATLALRGAWYAWDETLRQGYLELGFLRTVVVSLADAAEGGARLGVVWGAGWVLAPLVLLLVAARGRDFLTPDRLGARLSTRRGVMRAELAVLLLWGAGAAVAVLALGGHPWPDAVLLGFPALAGVLLLELLAWRVRARRGGALGPGWAASFGAALPALLLAYPVNEARHVFHPLGDDSLVANGTLALGTLVLFLLLRARYAGRTASWTGRAGAALLVLALLSPFALRVLGTLWGGAAFRPERPLNVLLIAIDTLRADSVTLEELAPGARDLTPNLRRLAARGTNYRVAVSQAPWTMPAMGSILTGKYSMQHGAVAPTGKIVPSTLTLSEILREAGYSTGAVVSNRYVGPSHGFAQGYEEFIECFAQGMWGHSAEEITDGAIDLVERRLDRPFFVYAHYSDPHFGYVDHAPWTFADGYRGRMRTEMRFPELSELRTTLDAEELRYLRDAYDEEIAFTDQEIGRLLDSLEREGLTGSTLIVVVADHGEGFLEHGHLGHTTSLYDELVRVPLMVVDPGDATARVSDTPVETRAIFSTVLAAVGIDYRAEGMPTSLVAEPEDQSPHVFSMLWRSSTGAAPETGARFASLRTERFKLILNPDTDELELYDLVADPGELHDLAGDEPPALHELEPILRDWLDRMLRSASEIPRADLPREQIEELEALGYL